MIRAWLERRRDKRKAADHKRGYSYAAGELLQSDGAAQERLEAETDAACHYGVFGAFDSGIDHALRDWRILHAAQNPDR
jgi:hypothetical protein